MSDTRRLGPGDDGDVHAEPGDIGRTYSARQFAGTNDAFAIMHELGGVSGPLVAGRAMDQAGRPHGLMLILAPVAAAYLGIIAILRALRPR